MMTCLKKISPKAIFPFFIFFIIGFLIYSNTLNGEFIYDDIINIQNNPLVQDFQKTGSLFSHHASRFFPFFSFSINYLFHQDSTFGYHLINTFLHIINTSLVFCLTRLLLQLHKFEQLNNHESFLLSFSTALIFLTHPIQTQAVSSIIQRITLLATMFYLGSIVLYIKSRIKNNHFLWGLSIIVCLMAMASKEHTATLPIMLVFLEMGFINNSQSNQRKKIPYKLLMPFFICLIIIPILLSHSMKFGRPIISITQETNTTSRPTYFMTQANVINTYISKLLFPASQNADYDYPLTQSPFDTKFLLSIFLLSLMTFFIIKWGGRNPIFILGWLWFLITLSVESSVIPIKDVIQEHRLYLPMIGFAWIAAYSLLKFIRPPKIYFTVVTMIILILSILAIHRNTVWKTEIVFWKDVISKSPHKSRAHSGLGAAYLRKGDLVEAETHLLNAIQLNPEDSGAHCNLAIIYLQMKNPQKALLHMTTAYDQEPDNPNFIKNLSQIYMENSKYENGFASAERLIDEFFSRQTLEHYFQLLVFYYHKTQNTPSTLRYAQALEQYLSLEHYQEIIKLLEDFILPKPSREGREAEIHPHASSI